MNDTFINSNRNDSFSLLRGMDLQDLLTETENYLLEYRDTLNLPTDVTFGVEIEYEGIFKAATDRFIESKMDGWSSSEDGSLRSGGEINSPVMIDEIKYWQELKKVCQYLSKRNANTSNNAGGHIHVGTCVLGNDIDAWRNFLKLYTAYENIIFRFAYGDKVNGRRKLENYAPAVADLIYKEMKKINTVKFVDELYYPLPTSERHAALNFCNTDFDYPGRRNDKNTLEFRCPNATSNEVVWQNNINAFTKMLVASRDKVMDEEFLDYKLKHEYLPCSENKYLYSIINLKNVLEFVDLVFDNNLDKVYFLRQYLKDFKEIQGMEVSVKSKKFVK